MPTGRICAESCTPTSSGCSWGGLDTFCCEESCRIDPVVCRPSYHAGCDPWCRQCRQAYAYTRDLPGYWALHGRCGTSHCCRCYGVGSDCVLALLRLPNVASCLVTPLPFLCDYARITIQRLDGDAALEVVDDVVIGDVGDGGSCVEEAFDLGSY